MDFIERIDLKLKEKNEKRSALCNAVGIDITAMSVWKKRGTIPAGDVCLRIAKYLNVSVEWLVLGEDAPKSKAPETKQSLPEDAMHYAEVICRVAEELKTLIQENR